MIKTKIAFSGNYQKEFGGNESRPWKSSRVFKDSKEVGSIYQEPSDYPYPFRTFKGGFETSGNYIGQFKTRKEALKSF